MPDERLDFSPVGKAMSPFETAVIVSATRYGQTAPHTTDKPVHLSFTTLDQVDTTTSSDGTVIRESPTKVMGALHYGLDIILNNLDTVVVDQFDAQGAKTARYTGLVGTPVARRSRRHVLFEIRDVEQYSPTPPTPGREFIDAKVTEPDGYGNLILQPGYQVAYEDGEFIFGNGFRTAYFLDDYGNLTDETYLEQKSEGWSDGWRVTRETRIRLLTTPTVDYEIMADPYFQDGVWRAKVGIIREFEVYGTDGYYWAWGWNYEPLPFIGTEQLQSPYPYLLPLYMGDYGYEETFPQTIKVGQRVRYTEGGETKEMTVSAFTPTNFRSMYTYAMITRVLVTLTAV